MLESDPHKEIPILLPLLPVISTCQLQIQWDKCCRGDPSLSACRFFELLPPATSNLITSLLLTFYLSIVYLFIYCETQHNIIQIHNRVLPD